MRAGRAPRAPATASAPAPAQAQAPAASRTPARDRAPTTAMVRRKGRGRRWRCRGKGGARAERARAAVASAPTVTTSQGRRPTMAAAPASRPVAAAVATVCPRGARRATARIGASPSGPGVSWCADRAVLMADRALPATPVLAPAVPYAPARQATKMSPRPTERAPGPPRGPRMVARASVRARGPPWAVTAAELRPPARTRAGTASPQQSTTVPAPTLRAHVAAPLAPLGTAGVAATRQVASRHKRATVMAQWIAAPTGPVVGVAPTEGRRDVFRCPRYSATMPLAVTTAPAVAVAASAPPTR